MSNIPVMERILIVLVLASLISSPLTGQYALQGLDWVFQQMFFYGYWVLAVTAGYLLFYLGIRYAKSQAVNIPKKTAKTKAQKYIA